MIPISDFDKEAERAFFSLNRELNIVKKILEEERRDAKIVCTVMFVVGILAGLLL